MRDNLDEARARAQAEPENPALWTLLGVKLRSEGCHEEAADAWRKAVALDPGGKLPGARGGLGLALISLGQLEEGEASLEESIRLKPTASQYVLLEDVRTRRGNDVGAREALRLALELEPDNVEALFGMGMCLRNDRDYHGALDYMRQVLALDPDNAFATREMGYVLSLSGGSLAEAERWGRRAVELAYDNEWAHICLGHILEDAGKMQEAEDEFRRACEVEPQQAFPLCFLGDFYKRQNDPGRATESYSMALERDPTDEAARQRLDGGDSGDTDHWLFGGPG